MVATDVIKNKIQNSIKGNSPYEVKDYGKMIRSRLGILVLDSINTEISTESINVMTATELIHTASLFHDDVIDNDKIRRLPHIGNKTAVIYGDLMLTNAINILLGINNPKILSIYNNAIKNMCNGELFQQMFAGKIPTLKQYIEKTELKTASLFVAEINALLILANADNNLKKNLIEFARLYGIAFQIKNDLKDTQKEQKDLKQKIYTAPYVLTNSTVLTESAIEKTARLLDNYIEKAEKCLMILKDSNFKETLIGETECLRK